eukprot:SAG31_NODE_2726_length_5182_cov_1.523903_1_plen_216_part_00
MQGLREANELGRFYAPVRSSELLRALTRDAGSPLAVVNCVQIFKKTGRRLLVMPSPFLRTCQTAWPLAQAMGPELCAVKVNMDVYENGGVYVIGHDANGKPIRDGPGKCLSAGDILAQFPGYDVSALPAEGPWYTSGFEDNEAAGARAERVATWLRSAALQHEVGSRVRGSCNCCNTMNCTRPHLAATGFGIDYAWRFHRYLGSSMCSNAFVLCD